MGKSARITILMLMVCSLASCANEVDFEHPTENDLMEARLAMGLPASPKHVIRTGNSADPSLTSEFKTESLIPNLSDELKMKREAYIKDQVSKSMRQTREFYGRLNMPSSVLEKSAEYAYAHHGLQWDSRNIPADTATDAKKTIQNQIQKRRIELSKKWGEIISPYQEAMRSQTGAQRFSQANNQQTYVGPEVSMEELTQLSQSTETSEHLLTQQRKNLQKKMDDAGIELAKSEVDKFLRLQAELQTSNNTIVRALKLKREGQNVSQETMTKLRRKQASIRHDLNKVTAELDDAIRVKREPEMRMKYIENMTRIYARQNKFPNGYDLELLYENQKAMKDLNREQSEVIQAHQQSPQNSAESQRELMKPFNKKRHELSQERREIESRIR